MFIEEDFEDYIETLVTDAQTASPTGEIAKIKRVERIDGSEVTLENFSRYAQISPSIVIGFTPEQRVLNPIGARQDAQYIAPMFRVFLITSGFDNPNAAYVKARPMLRALKNLFRGLRAGPSEGSADGYGRLIFNEQYLAAQESGVALFVQDYEFHTPDINTDERPL